MTFSNGDPVDPLGLLAPEAIGVDDGLLVHRLVGGFVGRGPCHRFRVHGVRMPQTWL
ncbi:hypothetical protein P4132_17275 [Pseudomonas aeruginosa]|nr:hypothetical protein [Pseudomonas aeruginosa]